MKFFLVYILITVLVFVFPDQSFFIVCQDISLWILIAFLTVGCIGVNKVDYTHLLSKKAIIGALGANLVYLAIAIANVGHHHILLPIIWSFHSYMVICYFRKYLQLSSAESQ